MDIHQFLNFGDGIYDLKVLKCVQKNMISFQEIVSRIRTVDGKKITPTALYDVILKEYGDDMYCRIPIESSIIKQLIMFVYDNKLYYINTDTVVELGNDPWNVDKYNECDSWNTYVIPEWTKQSDMVAIEFNNKKFYSVYSTINC